jgi:hypothetical protein
VTVSDLVITMDLSLFCNIIFLFMFSTLVETNQGIEHLLSLSSSRIHEGSDDPLWHPRSSAWPSLPSCCELPTLADL